MNTQTCPSQEELRCFVLGGEVSPAGAENRIARHLDGCRQCDTAVGQLEQDSDVVFDLVCSASSDRTFVTEPECQQALIEALATEATISSGALEAIAPALADGQIHNYVLGEQLGEGGMGTVFRAVHAKLQRDVAIKIIRPDRMSSPRAVARFQREMQAVGRLTHPNIVRATDAGEADGIHYLVMEYVDCCNTQKDGIRQSIVRSLIAIGGVD